jgi:putative membrane protein
VRYYLSLAEPAAPQSIGEKTGVDSALGITPKTTDFVAEVAASDTRSIEQTCRGKDKRG